MLEVEWWFNIVKFKLPQLRNQCSTLYDLQSPEIETTSTSGNAFNFSFANVHKSLLHLVRIATSVNEVYKKSMKMTKSTDMKDKNFTAKFGRSMVNNDVGREAWY